MREFTVQMKSDLIAEFVKKKKHFYNNSQLQDHKRTHTNNRPFQFENATHVANVSLEKPYQQTINSIFEMTNEQPIRYYR